MTCNCSPGSELDILSTAVAVAVAVVSVVAGQGPTAIWSSLRGGLAKTLRFNWCFWPIIQFAVYGFVPVRHRLMAVMSFNFLWSIILSRSVIVWSLESLAY